MLARPRSSLLGGHRRDRGADRLWLGLAVHPHPFTRAGNAQAPDSTSKHARSQPGRLATPGSALAIRLAVARRFSAAYMAYQTARLSRRARQTIRQTCTPAFARSLLAHPVLLPPALIAHPSDLEAFRVASVNPGPDGQVSVSYVSGQLSRGALQYRHAVSLTAVRLQRSYC